jgi:hypothetical protein
MQHSKLTIKECNTVMEACRASWREDAHKKAIRDAEFVGLEGTNRELYIRERERFHYAALERLGGDY